MWSDTAWAKILKETYGWTSEKVEGVLLFHLKNGLEMNPLGDYVEAPKPAFFKKAKASLRVDSPMEEVPGQIYVEQHLETYRLAVNEPFADLLKKRVHQKTRNLITKSQKMGVETKIMNDEESLKIYYKLYVPTMLKLGAIPQSFKLFESMWKHFGEGRMKIFISSKDGKVLSGILTLLDNKQKRLHIWSNAQSAAARPYSANMATYAAVLDYACKQKEIDEVDFGNTAAETSLAFFKSRFGAKKVPVWTVSPQPFKARKIPAWPVKALRFLPHFLLSPLMRLVFKTLR